MPAISASPRAAILLRGLFVIISSRVSNSVKTLDKLLRMINNEERLPSLASLDLQGYPLALGSELEKGGSGREEEQGAFCLQLSRKLLDKSHHVGSRAWN